MRLQLVLLQGLVPIFTLPGDKMFQSTGVQPGRHRPPIIHAYGGAKVGMAAALRSIAVEGWVPLAVAHGWYQRQKTNVG